MKAPVAGLAVTLALSFTAACSDGAQPTSPHTGGASSLSGGQAARGQPSTGGASAGGAAGGDRSGAGGSAAAPGENGGGAGGSGGPGGNGGALGGSGGSGITPSACDAAAVAALLKPYRCHDCHFQVNGNLREYDSVAGLNAVVGTQTARGALARCAIQTIVAPGMPQASLLYVKLAGTLPESCGDHMPRKQGAQEQRMLSSEELSCVAEWINGLAAVAGAGGLGGSAGRGN